MGVILRQYLNLLEVALLNLVLLINRAYNNYVVPRLLIYPNLVWIEKRVGHNYLWIMTFVLYLTIYGVMILLLLLLLFGPHILYQNFHGSPNWKKKINKKFVVKFVRIKLPLLLWTKLFVYLFFSVDQWPIFDVQIFQWWSQT